jgi:nucleoside permease NupC
MILIIIATLTIIPFIIKVLNLNDIPLAIVGLTSGTMGDIILGTLLSPYGYFIGIPFGTIAGLGLIGKKAYMSKIVAINEIGKIYSFLTLLETIVPAVASILLNYLFEYTINSYPSAVYQIVGALDIITVCTLIWIDLYCKRPYED